MYTIIATVEVIAELYRDYIVEYLESHNEDVTINEYADDLATLSYTLKQMTSKDPLMQLYAFRKVTREGYTMVMFPIEIETLEQLSKDGEDFRVALFREDGSPVGIINKHELHW